MMGSKNPESCVTFYDGSKLGGITSLPNKNADGTSESLRRPEQWCQRRPEKFPVAHCIDVKLKVGKPPYSNLSIFLSTNLSIYLYVSHLFELSYLYYSIYLIHPTYPTYPINPICPICPIYHIYHPISPVLSVPFVKSMFLSTILSSYLSFVLSYLSRDPVSFLLPHLFHYLLPIYHPIYYPIYPIIYHPIWHPTHSPVYGPYLLSNPMSDL